MDHLPPQRPDQVERVTIVGPTPGGGYTFAGLDGELYHGKPTIVGGHQPGDRPHVGFVSGARREPVIIEGWQSTVRRVHNRLLFPQTPSRSTILYWSQSEASHLRNNCATESARLPSMSGSAAAIYTYYSKAGSLHDSRGRAYGLVSYREGTAPRLAVSYPRFNSSGTALEAYRIDVLDNDGALIRSIEFSTTTLAPFGNFAPDQLFLNQDNTHFWLTPVSSVDMVRMRAWNDGSPHQLTTASDRPNSFISVAYNAVLYPAFTAEYTGGANASGSPPAYWPPSIIPLGASLTGSIQGLVRNASEVISSSWAIDPSVICNLPRSIMSSMAGVGTGWPAAPDGTSWTVAVSERSLMDGTIPANAALGHGYREADPYTGGTIQHNTNLGSYTHSLQLNIGEIDSSNGNRLWVKRFTISPSAPIIAEGLLSPFESYMASPFGSGPGDRGYGPVIIEGRVLENELSDKIDLGFPGEYVAFVYPGRISASLTGSGTEEGVAFNWPQFEYFPGVNMRLFPHRPNNVLAIPASSETSSFYTGCKNNLAAFTDFGVSSDGCGPGIFRDTQGNIYFSYMFPRGFLVQGRILTRSTFPSGGGIQMYDRHLPSMAFGWESRQVSLDKNGVLRWERDLTQWKSDAEWWGRSGSDYGFDFIVGGAVGGSLPLSDNVYWQIPVGDGKFLITIKEYHGPGSSFRPDMYLEVQDGATGTVLQSQFLPDYFDLYTADIRRDPGTGAISPTGTLIAYAGERKWFVADSKVKAGVDAAGIPWAIIFMNHSTRDPWDGIASYDQIYVIQAPADGSIGAWSAVTTWNPGPSDIYPGSADWASVIISDGFMCWTHWDGSAWKVYKKAL